jgi:hypothetical protein
MTAWTSDELDTIGAAEELHLAPQRRDSTLRQPVIVWVVRVGDDLYARSWRGSGGAWFRAARASHTGRIRAGGVEKDVTFVEESDPGINDQIDAAYRLSTTVATLQPLIEAGATHLVLMLTYPYPDRIVARLADEVVGRIT